MLMLPQSYRRLGSFDGNGLEVWQSPDAIDPAWDDFLRNSPHGHYQQSSLWGSFKSEEGWRQHRVVVTDCSKIVGGFQILWKKKHSFGFGYVSKGPIVDSLLPADWTNITQTLAKTAKDIGLWAVIVQPPDNVGSHENCDNAIDGCIRSNPMKVIEATYLVDVHEGMDVVRKRMHRNVRQCVRKSREQGVGVRSGTEEDLPLFFELMSATCRRQNSAANPASVESLRRLWRLFAPSGSVEMALAGRDGTFVAGRMNLIFGRRVTQWKKGWDGTHSDWHANELLADHALEWAHANGYQLCDFSAIRRATAEHILAGKPTDGAIARSRDMFNLRLGGYPQLLPRARIHLTNPILRWGYRNTYERFEKNRELRSPTH